MLQHLCIKLNLEIVLKYSMKRLTPSQNHNNLQSNIIKNFNQNICPMQAAEIKEKINLKKSEPLSQYRRGWDDIKTGLFAANIWSLLSWQDIKLRYRRSTLGPLWITLSMAITIYAMGFLYGTLFKMELSNYFPYLASGILAWSLISSLLLDSTNIFIDSESFLKQMKQPYSIFIFRTVLRNFTIFFHNILVFVPIALFFHVKFNFNTLFFFIGLAIIWINGVSYCTILSILGARYRDLTQLVVSFVQVIFFITPIMWSPDLLPAKYHFIATYNPFSDFIQLLRNPLLGLPLPLNSLAIILAVTVFGLVLSYCLFIKFRSRIVYWL